LKDNLLLIQPYSMKMMLLVVVTIRY